MKTHLIEVCVICGFVHRDDRTQTRQRKPHYHWAPPGGETVVNGFTLHATVCVACITTPLDWDAYLRARKATPKEYYLAESYNATLPFAPSEVLSQQYEAYCVAMIAEI